MSNLARVTKHSPFNQMEESKKFYLTNSRYVEEALKMLELIHPNNTGYYGLFNKDEIVYQRFITEPPSFNLMMNYLHIKDLYLSMNSFYIPKRQIAYIRQINAFYIDIDYYKIQKYKGKTTEQMISIMRNDGMFKNLEPSFFMDSGNGMYIFYLIEDVPKQCKKLWTKIEKLLVQKFLKYGADPNAKDLARFLRIAGSINSKTGRRARLILESYEPVRYTLKKIQAIMLPPLPYSKEEWLELKEERRKKKKEYKEESKNSDNKVVSIYNTLNLNFKRMCDVKSLIELRSNDVEGVRNIALHMYSLFGFYTYGIDTNIEDYNDKVWTNLYELNNKLIEPLTKNELKKIYDSSRKSATKYYAVLKEYNDLEVKPSKVLYLRDKGCYIYTNSSIINKLNINEDEMEQLDILINLTEKNKRRRLKYKDIKITEQERLQKYYKNKLKEEGKISKKEQLKLIYKKIKSLKLEGFKNKEIAQRLSLPTKTLERHITYMKKNGLL